ncbi:MAG: SCP2 sterol-binding domain-containing protein, partial [Pseudomonadota bacterium]|nr:SCP2 sterol-binding domain-containing protein [Pseudomonadota bacterium]
STMEPFGKVIEMRLDDHRIFLDGTVNPPALAGSDEKNADVSVRAGLKNFVAILNKEMSPQMAMIKGKIKVRGDIMSVMALTKLL